MVITAMTAPRAGRSRSDRSLAHRPQGLQGLPRPAHGQQLPVWPLPGGQVGPPEQKGPEVPVLNSGADVVTLSPPDDQSHNRRSEGRGENQYDHATGATPVSQITVLIRFANF